jgi:hypothetical protein
MLGRLVVLARDLSDLAHARVAITGAQERWHVSAIVAADSNADHEAVASFNASPIRQLAVVDAIECKPTTIERLDALADRWRSAVDVYVEIDPAADVDAWCGALASRRLRGKLRTGGTTVAAFPSASLVVRFIAAALAAGTPFKATAGLHHPLHGRYRLTYDANAASAPMLGFLNVLLATAALRAGASTARAEQLLGVSDASSVALDDEGIGCLDHRFSNELLHEVREFLIAFGSCSFREPVDELHALVAHRSH